MVYGKQNYAASDFAQLLKHVLKHIASWQACSHSNAWTRFQVTAVGDLCDAQCVFLLRWYGTVNKE